MSTTKSINEHLTILEGTKEAIKSAIRMKEVSVQDTDTFRSYAEAIRGIVKGTDDTTSSIKLNVKANESLIVETPRTTSISCYEDMVKVHKGTVLKVPYGTEEPNLQLGDYLENENFVITDIQYHNNKLTYFVEVQNDIEYEGSIAEREGVTVCDVQLTNGFIKPIVQLNEQEAEELGYVLIYNAEGLLEALTNAPAGKYILMNDLDCTGVVWKNVSIATGGVLNGNGYKIKNITWNTNLARVGMFYDVYGQITNLYVENCHFTNNSTSTGTINGVLCCALQFTNGSRTGIYNCVIDSCSTTVTQNRSTVEQGILMGVWYAGYENLTNTVQCIRMRKCRVNSPTTQTSTNRRTAIVCGCTRSVNYSNDNSQQTYFNFRDMIIQDCSCQAGNYFIGSVLSTYCSNHLTQRRPRAYNIRHNCISSLVYACYNSSVTLTTSDYVNQTVTDYFIGVYNSAGTFLQRYFYSANTSLNGLISTLMSAYGFRDVVDIYGVHHLESPDGYVLQGSLHTAIEDALKFRGAVDIKNNKVVMRQNEFIGTEDNSSTGNSFYLNTVKNTLHSTTDSSVPDDGVLSFPLFKCTTDMTYFVKSIDEIYNGVGYFAKQVWHDRDVVALIPCGKNDDESCKFIVYATPYFEMDEANTTTTLPVTYIKYFDNDSYSMVAGIHGGNNKVLLDHYVAQENEPNKIGRQLWYKPSDNLYYAIEGELDDWQVVYPVVFSKKVLFDDNRVQAVEPNKGVGLVSQTIII